MAVPKQHRSKSRQGQRRMHLFVKSPSTVACSHCGRAVFSHTACAFCGYYKGKEAIKMKQKKGAKKSAKKHSHPAH